MRSWRETAGLALSVPIGTTDTAAPFNVQWDTRANEPGQVTLAAVARDAAGSTTTSKKLVVQVRNVS